MPTSIRTHEYLVEFKTKAVQLALTSGKSRCGVADELYVGLSTLCKWVKQHHRAPNAAEVISPVSGLSTQQTLEQEVRRLKRELEIVRLLAPEGSTFLILTMHLLAPDTSTFRAWGADGQDRFYSPPAFLPTHNGSPLSRSSRDHVAPNHLTSSLP